MLGRAVTLVAAAALLGVAIGGAGAGTAGVERNQAVQTRPNIIVVMADDMRQDDMVVMRNVQRLIGAQGTTFENSIVSFALCCPSRATFLTGQYAHNHGVQGNHAPEGGYTKLRHANTLAVWLQRAGYATVHLGKYLNDYGKPPSRPTEIPPGWTEWYGSLALAYIRGTMNVNGTVTPLGRGYATDLYTDRAVEIVKRRTPSRQPFFLWASYYAPHAGSPSEPDDPAGIPTPAVADRHRDRFASLPPNRLPSFDAPTPTQSRKPLTQEQIAQIDEARRQRLESLLALDEGVARIVAALPPAERANTVILFTSDNGFFLGEHRLPWGKQWPYEEALRVPLLVRGPGVPKGARVRSLVANIDLAPTLLAFARARAGLAQDGTSLRRYFADPRTASGRAYLIESTVNAAGVPFVSGVRTQRYLYLEYRGSSASELYDLQSDPYELTSQSKNPAYAAVRTRLARELQTLRSCAGTSCDVRSP